MARRQDLNKRIRILDAAFSTFRSKGYKETAIKDVALQAGVAAGSIYTYFPDKEALFHATVEEGWSRFILELENATSFVTSPDDKLSILIEMGFHRLKNSYNLIHEILHQDKLMLFFRDALQRNCIDILRITGLSSAAGSTEDESSRINFIRIVLAGIVVLISISGLEDLEKEISGLKAGIRAGLFSLKAVTV